MKVENETLIKFTNMDVINHFGKVKLSKKIKIIGNYAFRGCTLLKKIKISNSVTKIGTGAFEDCTSLTEIEIPNSVTEIGANAFFDCTSLTKIEIPNSVTKIGNCAFEDCTSLTEIVIPNSVTKIGYGTFYNCKSLTKIEIPNSVTEMGESAFYKCTSLTKIEIPNSVTEIGANAFFDCTSLTEIAIPEGVTEISFGVFCGCTSLTKIEILEGVTKIDDRAFESCTSLTEIKIPNSVTEIGAIAFCNCKSLTEIEIPEGVTKIDDYAFQGCTSLKSLHLSKNLRLIYTNSFYKCDNIGLIIETSLFFIKKSFLRKSKINCLPHNTTIYGIKCNSTELIPTIQKRELEDKISEYLKNKNIIDKNGDHSKFINHVIKSYKGRKYYDYRNDFEKYMEDYIKYLNTKKKTESKIKSFNDKVEMKDGSDAHKSNVGQQRELIKPMNYALTELYEYANKIGLMPWVDRLRARLNISLLCGNIPKTCFDDINHIYFIKEIIQSLSEDIDYDYNSAIKEYAKYYIESHNSLNKNNIDNKKKVSLDKKPLTLRKK